MTALTTRADTSPASAPNVAKILDRFVGPARRYHAARAQLDPQTPLPEVASPERAGEMRSHSREADCSNIQRTSRKLLPLAELIEVRSEMQQAACEPVDEKVARLLLGVLFDSFRQPPGEAAGVMISSVLALLLDDVDDFDEDARPHAVSAASLAWAVRRLIRTNRFPPSVSEILDACRAAEKTFRSAVRTAERQIAWRREADAFLEAVARLPPPPLPKPVDENCW